MNVKEELQKKFAEVKNAFFEKEGTLNFLRVEVGLSSLEEVTKISREISDHLDTIYDSDKEYFLDIYSSGTEKTVSWDEAMENIDQNIALTIRDKINDKNNFEGRLLSINEDELEIRWNLKGQIKTTKINKENILEIKLSAKAR